MSWQCCGTSPVPTQTLSPVCSYATVFGLAWYCCVCRSGLVISIAEPDTLFVIKKMAKRLQVPIEKAAVSEGILGLDDEAADLPAATAAQA